MSQDEPEPEAMAHSEASQEDIQAAAASGDSTEDSLGANAGDWSARSSCGGSTTTVNLQRYCSPPAGTSVASIEDGESYGSSTETRPPPDDFPRRPTWMSPQDADAASAVGFALEAFATWCAAQREAGVDANDMTSTAETREMMSRISRLVHVVSSLDNSSACIKNMDHLECVRKMLEGKANADDLLALRRSA